MAVDESGLNQAGVESAINNVIDGGATIHLLTSQAEFTDDATDLEGKSDAQETVDESDFTINFGASFSDTSEVELVNDVEFGPLDIGTVFNVAVIGSGDNAFVGIEENEPELTGEDFTIPAGETVYEIGNVL